MRPRCTIDLNNICLSSEVYSTLGDETIFCLAVIIYVQVVLLNACIFYYVNIYIYVRIIYKLL
jgi:hypothetical protein